MVKLGTFIIILFSFSSSVRAQVNAAEKKVEVQVPAKDKHANEHTAHESHDHALHHDDHGEAAHSAHEHQHAEHHADHSQGEDHDEDVGHSLAHASHGNHDHGSHHAGQHNGLEEDGGGEHENSSHQSDEHHQSGHVGYHQPHDNHVVHQVEANEVELHESPEIPENMGAEHSHRPISPSTVDGHKAINQNIGEHLPASGSHLHH